MWILAVTMLLSASPAPDGTVPQGAKVLREVEGRGVQIYRCGQHEGEFRWTLEAPEATLYDHAGQTVGSHGAGPLWKWADGSSVRGTVVRKQDSPNSIPWLLLSASPAADVRGVLSDVTWVRRSGTQGGLAPGTGCDASHEHETSRVPYSATYTFYLNGTPK